MERAVTDYILDYKRWFQHEGSRESSIEMLDLLYEKGSDLKKYYNVSWIDIELLKTLWFYANFKNKKIASVIENWYFVTGRDMKSIRQNFEHFRLSAVERCVEFPYYYNAELNTVDYVIKVDGDGVDATEQFLDDWE